MNYKYMIVLCVICMLVLSHVVEFPDGFPNRFSTGYELMDGVNDQFYKGKQELLLKDTIKVRALAGCCNKIRYAVAWMEIAHKLNKKFEIVWQTKHIKEYGEHNGHLACLGTWQDVFEDVPGVTFKNEYVPDLDSAGYHTAEDIYFKVMGEELDLTRVCKYLKFNTSIKQVGRAFLNTYPVHKATAVHIRRGDFPGKLTDEVVTQLLRDLGERNDYIFLLTDDSQVQRISKQVLGNKVFWFKTLKTSRVKKQSGMCIYNDQLPKQIQKVSPITSGCKRDKDPFSRPTTFYEAAIDMYIASHAKHFVPTSGSSFSDLITLLRSC